MKLWTMLPSFSPLERAMIVVQGYIDAGLKEKEEKPEYDIFVVWYAKTLQNWKALVGSTLPDQEYYEVTFDGDKNKIYLDVYIKHANFEFSI